MSAPTYTIDAIDALDRLARATNQRAPSEVQSLNDRMRASMQAFKMSAMASSQNKFGVASAAALPNNDDDVTILPIDESPANPPPFDIYTDLLERLRRLKLDPDPKKAAKQITELVKSMRDPRFDEKLAFRNLDAWVIAVNWCYYKAMKPEEGEDGLPIPPEDPVADEALKEALKIARGQLWGLNLYMQNWRDKIMNPDPDSWGSPGFQFNC